MIRLPLPYRIGENRCPGNADEKVRCEVETYTWVKENCPTVPIPHLYGFGLSMGKLYARISRRLELLLTAGPSSQTRQPSFFYSKHPASTPMASADPTLPCTIFLR